MVREGVDYSKYEKQIRDTGRAMPRRRDQVRVTVEGFAIA
jgi:hypothetical protein